MLLTILLQAAQPATGKSGMMSSLLMIGLLIIAFWLFFIRPQSKKAKEQQKFRDELKKGDKVVTIGGIHGKIVDIKDSTFTIEIAHDVRIEVDKAAISFNEAALGKKPAEKKEEKQENE